jgi:hypothetical protein
VASRGLTQRGIQIRSFRPQLEYPVLTVSFDLQCSKPTTLCQWTNRIFKCYCGNLPANVGAVMYRAFGTKHCGIRILQIPPCGRPDLKAIDTASIENEAELKLELFAKK